MTKHAQAYVKERDKMLQKSLDEFAAWAIPKIRRINGKRPDEAVLEITYHKLRTACVKLPMELRIQSKKWLLERGLTPHDDGDVKVD